MKSKTKLMIAGAALAFVVPAFLAMAAIVFLISRSFAEQRRLGEAVAVYRHFEAAVKDGRLEEAYQRCTEQCRRKRNLAELQNALKLTIDTPEAEAQKVLKLIADGRNPEGFSSDSEMKHNEDCTEVTFDEAVRRRQKSVHYSVKLIRAGDSWLVDDVVVIWAEDPPKQRP